ncbi:hypothetical protein CR513_53039, partial [Mucuna pruriens]
MGLTMALEHHVEKLKVFDDSALVIYQLHREWETRDAKLIPYHDHIKEIIESFDMYLSCEAIEVDSKPLYLDIKRYLEKWEYPEGASKNSNRTLRRLAFDFLLSGTILYKRNVDMTLLCCIDRQEVERIIEEVHEGIFGTHANGHALARKILRTYANHINVAPSTLHNLTSPWPFSMWGIYVIGPIESKASNGHRFILVAIDYFTKWVEAVSYSNVTHNIVARFVKREIICYGLPAHIITDNDTNLNNEVMTMRAILDSPS